MYDVGSLLVDRYRLVAILGEGGMGRVWRAQDTVLHRQVAIKEVVAPTKEGAEMFLARAEREARNLAAVHQVQGIVKVFDVVKADGRPWIIMEFFELPNLQKYVEDHGVFTAAALLPMALQLIRALREVHACNIMHRDIKPANLLVKPDGGCVLIDFGIARHGDDTLTIGAAIGTLAYMAPEYLRNHRATEAVDAWAVGLLLYFALTGESPFRRESQPATMLAIMNDPVPRLNGAGALYDVVNGLLQKSPAKRMKLDVAERLLQEEAAVTPPPQPRRPRRQVPRRWLVVGAAAVAMVVAGVVAIPHLWHHPAQPIVQPGASATATPAASLTPSGTPSVQASPTVVNMMKVVAPSGWRLAYNIGDHAVLTQGTEKVGVVPLRDAPVATLAEELHKSINVDSASTKDITYVGGGFAIWPYIYGARCAGSVFPCRFEHDWIAVVKVPGGTVEVTYGKDKGEVPRSTAISRLRAVTSGVTVIE